MLEKIVRKVREHGVTGAAAAVARIAGEKSGYTSWRVRHAPRYASPTSDELAVIEDQLSAVGVQVHDYEPSPELFRAFKLEKWFPADYHGGEDGGVWDEKLLEHWIAREKLDLMGYGADDVYVDIAACGSPWAQVLRERANVQAFAIDLNVPRQFRSLPFYRADNATRTSFPSASITGASLQCAYEMFMRNDDTLLVEEVARMLKPGGKVVILPLYMHTHYCAYATPEYFGKGYSDPSAKEYVRPDCYGVPSSRKYDAVRLVERVLKPIERSGMRYRLEALRNKAAFGDNVYCHFILEVQRETIK